MKNFLLLLLLAFGHIEGFAQGQLVKGKIVDENNKPLIGATVTLKVLPSLPLLTSLEIFKSIRVTR